MVQTRNKNTGIRKHKNLGVAKHGRTILGPHMHMSVVLRSHQAVASLEASALDLGQRIQRLKQDALRENRQGQKRAALVQMRRMKQLQGARDKRLSSLFTLETALDQVGCHITDFSFCALHCLQHCHGAGHLAPGYSPRSAVYILSPYVSCFRSGSFLCLSCDHGSECVLR